MVLMFPAGGLWHGGLLPCHSMAGGGCQSLPRLLWRMEDRGWGKSWGCLGSPGLRLFPGRGVSKRPTPFITVTIMLYICFTTFSAFSCLLIYFIFPTGLNVSGRAFFFFLISIFLMWVNWISKEFLNCCKAHRGQIRAWVYFFLSTLSNVLTTLKSSSPIRRWFLTCISSSCIYKCLVAS